MVCTLNLWAKYPLLNFYFLTNLGRTLIVVLGKFYKTMWNLDDSRVLKMLNSSKNLAEKYVERSLKRVEPFLNLMIVSTDWGTYGRMCIIHHIMKYCSFLIHYKNTFLNLHMWWMARNQVFTSNYKVFSLC